MIAGGGQGAPSFPAPRDGRRGAPRAGLGGRRAPMRGRALRSLIVYHCSGPRVKDVVIRGSGDRLSDYNLGYLEMLV